MDFPKKLRSCGLTLDTTAFSRRPSKRQVVRMVNEARWHARYARAPWTVRLYLWTLAAILDAALKHERWISGLRAAEEQLHALNRFCLQGAIRYSTGEVAQVDGNGDEGIDWPGHYVHHYGLAPGCIWLTHGDGAGHQRYRFKSAGPIYNWKQDILDPERGTCLSHPILFRSKNT